MNPYNRLSTMKGTVTRVFTYLEQLSNKYNITVRIGWNGFAGYVNRNESGEKYDFRAKPKDGTAAHDLKDLETMSITDLLNSFNKVGDTDGATTGGGTRPDKAFKDASVNMGYDASDSTAKYLILITDGAPQGGGDTTATALSNSKTEGQNITNNKDVKIITVGLSTERVAGADELFRAIAYDPEIGEQLKYQAADGAKLESALEDAIMQTVQKVTIISDIEDTIDSAFYPVSSNGKPLERSDWIDLDGNYISEVDRDPDTPHGVIDKDSEGNWKVTWSEQDVAWVNADHPNGWHGRVLVKAKEDFLGGNTIPTNEKDATIQPIRLKNPVTGDEKEFDEVYSPDDYSLDDAPAELPTPHVNVDDLYIPPQETSWTVYLNTEVDPYTQIKELYKNISVLEIVHEDETDPSHRLVPVSDTDMGMIYDLTNGNGDDDIIQAIRDGRDTNGTDRNTIPLSEYLKKWTVSVETDEIVYGGDGSKPAYCTPTVKKYTQTDLQDDEWEKLLAGDPVYREYSEYDHSPGLIKLTLTQNVAAGEGGLPDAHETKQLGKVEEYTLKAEYIPYLPTTEAVPHIGSFRTSAMGIGN